MARRGKERGVTLVELLITLAIVGIAASISMLGAGVADGARLKRSAVMIAGAIRISYAHANSISKPVRLVMDLEERTVGLEQSSTDLKIAKNDQTGGAAAATDAERKAVEESEQIVKGARPPRPSFVPAKALGFSSEAGKRGKLLERNIRFLQVETAHQDTVVKTGRAYLYFWPGGQTERAAIQLSINGLDTDVNVMTILVSPLTGKAEIRKGRYLMPRPRDDREESERQDTGF